MKKSIPTTKRPEYQNLRAPLSFSQPPRSVRIKSSSIIIASFLCAVPLLFGIKAMIKGEGLSILIGLVFLLVGIIGFVLFRRAIKKQKEILSAGTSVCGWIVSSSEKFSRLDHKRPGVSLGDHVHIRAKRRRKKIEIYYEFKGRPYLLKHTTSQHGTHENETLSLFVHPQSPDEPVIYEWALVQLK